MSEIKKGIKWLLFASSYIPLYFILIFKHCEITVRIPKIEFLPVEALAGTAVPIVSILWGILTVISFAMLLLVIHIRRSKGGQDFKNVNSHQSRDELVTTYVLVYIFPFVVLDYTAITNWIAFVVFFLVIGIIQVRSNQLYVNPILALLGYQVYEIETDDKTITLVSKGGLEEPVGSVRTVELSNNVHMTV